MTNQEINERVAKLCGWTAVEDKDSNLWHLSNTDGRIIGYNWGCSEALAWRILTPRYTESLDACGEFESAMNAQEKVVYADYLVDLCGDDSYDPIFATALQRCEAFLRLKGQWE